MKIKANLVDIRNREIVASVVEIRDGIIYSVEKIDEVVELQN